MKKLSLILGLLLSLNVFAGKCIFDKKGMGQDDPNGDLSEISDLLKESNPSCDFPNKEQCEAYQMTNLFNMEVSPCLWKESKVGQAASRTKCGSSNSDQSKCMSYPLECRSIGKGKISCKNGNRYKLIKELSAKDFSGLVDQLENLNRGDRSDRHYWPDPSLGSEQDYEDRYRGRIDANEPQSTDEVKSGAVPYN